MKVKLEMDILCADNSDYYTACKVVEMSARPFRGDGISIPDPPFDGDQLLADGVSHILGSQDEEDLACSLSPPHAGHLELTQEMMDSMSESGWEIKQER
jgi:hypothetical protein